MSPTIIRTDFSTEATLAAPLETGGKVRYFLRRVLRRLGLIAPAPSGLNLFQANMGAYRFETDDGRVAIIPVTMELVNNAAIDAEALAREMALEELQAV